MSLWMLDKFFVEMCRDCALIVSIKYVYVSVIFGYFSRFPCVYLYTVPKYDTQFFWLILTRLACHSKSTRYKRLSDWLWWNSGIIFFKLKSKFEERELVLLIVWSDMAAPLSIFNFTNSNLSSESFCLSFRSASNFFASRSKFSYLSFSLGSKFSCLTLSSRSKIACLTL